MGRARKRREAKLAARIATATLPTVVIAKTARLRRRQLGTVGDVAGAEIETARRDALDIQAPGFWRKVWG